MCLNGHGNWRWQSGLLTVNPPVEGATSLTKLSLYSVGVFLSKGKTKFTKSQNKLFLTIG